MTTPTLPDENYYDMRPYGRLGIIPLASCAELGSQIDNWLVRWREERDPEHKESISVDGYERDTYIIPHKCSRFGTGEAKGVLLESVRGDDIYILVDVCNHSLTYKVCGYVNHMSPDDHYQDLKRVIAAIGGKARRINVIMPINPKAH